MSEKSQATHKGLAYPKRPSWFFHRYVRLLFKSCAANVIGDSGCWLLTTIAATEDSRRYSTPPTFYNTQLAPMCGCSVDKLARVRKTCIEAGYLHYEQPLNRSAALYWCLLPSELERWADDGPLGEHDSDFVPQNAEQVAEQDADSSATEVRSNRDQAAERTTIELRSTCGTSLPTPFPNPPPSPSPVVGWTETVERELVERLKTLGMVKARDAVAAAKSNGLTPAKVIEAAGHWEAKLKATHGVGALFDWIREATANQAVDDVRFWQTPKGSPCTAANEMRAGMPKAAYQERISTIRQLGMKDKLALADAVGIDREKFDEFGIDILTSDERDRLVIEFAKRSKAD